MRFPVGRTIDANPCISTVLNFGGNVCLIQLGPPCSP